MGTQGEEINQFKLRREEKEPFTERKETVVRMKEPFKFKAVPFAAGYRIEFTVNMGWEEVDSLDEENGPVVQGIRKMKKIIETEMESHVIGVDKKE